MKKVVSIVLLVCMLTGVSLSSPVPLVWMFCKEVLKAVFIGGTIDIVEDMFDKEYMLGWMPCSFQEVYGSYESWEGEMQVCYAVDEGMSECSVEPKCIRMN
ncbi:hypothetical protein JXR74_03800 [Candidatus Mcinerneyibacteriota bacterium]|nr:hypothetical protein [Candidatus Aminicenantes bacterium]MBN2726474.1 hypothetical protein [Candidatus Mcinerneyibacteriota bacterium]